MDVTTSQEAGLIEADDEQQAAYGLTETRVVFTHARSERGHSLSLGAG